MPIIKEDPKYSWKTLVGRGVPLFILAGFISITTHQYAHIIVHKLTYGTIPVSGAAAPDVLHAVITENPIAAAAGPVWTFMLALASFGIYLHNPRNLFAAAMAFINASIRIPETSTVFLQLLIYNKTTLLVDESFSLSLIRLSDPTISVVILCFFFLTILFLTITIIHDTKTIPRKWLVAIVLFLTLIPMQNLFSRFITQFLV